MENALIVSSSDKGSSFIQEMLAAASIRDAAVIKSCGEARRLLLERVFDLVVINAPLRDESGESLSRYIASNGIAQVILVVKSEFYAAVSKICEEDGVLTVSKPVSREVFWSVLKFAGSAQKQLTRVRAENSLLKQKISDIRIIDRAKCLLISYRNMSEQEAHRCIEKQAMDLRLPRRDVAEGIIKTYDNRQIKEIAECTL